MTNTKQRVTEAIMISINPLIEEITEALQDYEFLRDHFVAKGECFTLPNGDCLGNQCIHQVKGKDG